MIKKIIRFLRRARFPYSNLIEISISADNILHNLHQFQKLFDSSSVAPVLKSNAYGHGLVEVAHILDKEAIPLIIVDSYFEALSLRRNDIKSPLLIIGYTPTENILKSNLKNISFTITNLETLKEIAEQATKPVKIHIKVDTGMNRQGILPEDIEQAISLTSTNKNIDVEGICSHLADADNDDPAFTHNQIEKWNRCVTLCREKISTLKLWHISATAGHAHIKGIDSNMTRLGLGLYGISGNKDIDSKIKLKPALQMNTSISGIKKIKKGSTIGYNGTFTAPCDMTIATIPVGYYEGIDRRLSNKGKIKIGDQFAPIVGRISMNITTIDITDISDVKINDKVTVISSDSKDENSAQNIARICDTIPYEIFVHIPRHLLRKVV